MIQRKPARIIGIGSVKIGGDNDVSIQSMAKTDTCDVAATVSQINSLETAGCEIVRVAVKDINAAKAISDIKKEIVIPLVADIHFDHELATTAIRAGADKIRINPGNIMYEDKWDLIINEAKTYNIPIRIGVNSGSLPEYDQTTKTESSALADTALKTSEYFEKKGFNDLVLSMKSSDIVSTVEAYKIVSKRTDIPLHLGVTAAGLPEDGIIRSSAGIGALLLDGIGDTIRVSLTGDPVLEIRAAKRLLAALGLRHFGPEIIACPTCGRCQVGLMDIAVQIEGRLKGCTKNNIKVAIMGCEVNGPGEAKNADIGIAFGRGKGAIFKKGKIIKTVDVDKSIDELIDEIGNL